MIAPDIPQSDRVIMTTREKRIVTWVHGYGYNSPVVSSEVVDVSVLRQGHQSDDVILFGAGVNSIFLVLKLSSPT